jgi:HD-GYP domain-containing protein (c-di-GMP phosphodiesterase class II)
MSPMAHVNAPAELPCALAGDARAGAFAGDPLLVLDQFLQDLPQCEPGSRQLRLLLKTIAHSLQAEVVFLQSLTQEEVFETVGRFPVTAAWGRHWLRGLLVGAQGADRLLVHTPAGLPSAPDLPAPHSAALAQISQSRETWVAALSFSPGRQFQPADLQLMVLARRLLVTYTGQARAAERLQDTLLGLIHCLTTALDAKDPYTCGHSERVARMAVRIGSAMGLGERAISDLYLAGLLHDIGKIGIQDRVLQNPGPLTAAEMRHVQEHPVIGDRIISKVSQLASVRPGVRHHHERYDGQGYPDRLAGPEIPLQARILAVADSCDAMLSPRPYRPAMPPNQMELLMAQGAGRQWDPQVVDRFLACCQDLYGIRQKGIGDSLALALNHALGASAGPFPLGSSVTRCAPERSQPQPVLGQP